MHGTHGTHGIHGIQGGAVLIEIHAECRGILLFSHKSNNSDGNDDKIANKILSIVFDSSPILNPSNATAIRRCVLF